MDQLDLHGLRYIEVQPLVEDFILQASLPVIIITGNSYPMQKIVKDIVARYGLSWDYESHWNLGAIVVNEKRI